MHSHSPWLYVPFLCSRFLSFSARRELDAPLRFTGFSPNASTAFVFQRLAAPALKKVTLTVKEPFASEHGSVFFVLSLSFRKTFLIESIPSSEQPVCVCVWLRWEPERKLID